jgi:tetratricopeptide (TPR) repeat protein
MRSLRKQSKLALFFVCASVSAGLSQNDSAWWSSFYQKGLELIEQKQYEAAREQFESILKRDNKVAQAHYGLGLSSAAEKPDNREALKHFRRATQINPQYAEAYCQSGLVYARMKRYNDARNAFRTATQKNPAFVEAWLKLGETEAESGGSSGVVEAYQDAYRNVPDSEVLYDKLVSAAILHHEEGKVIAFLEGMPANSDSLRRLLDLAYLHYIASNLDKSTSIVSTIPPEKATARIYLLNAIFSFANEDDKAGLAYYWSAVNNIQSEADAAAFLRDHAYLMRSDEYDTLMKTPISEVWKFYYRFWRSRDPSLSTDDNERIGEYFRRLSYARKWYRRTASGHDRRYKLEHPLRQYIQPKVGSEMIGPYLSNVVSTHRELDDMGLIYLRHGKPDRTVSYVSATDETSPQSTSWKYQPAWNHPELIFHFVKYGGSYGWVLTSLPVAFNGLWEFGGTYVQLDPERPEIKGLLATDFSRLYDSLQQENLESARIGVQTETTDFKYEGVEPFDFPFHFTTFRGDNGKLLLEVYYGINGSETLLKSTEQGNVLSLQEFFGFYDEQWNEAGKISRENNVLLGVTAEQWRNAGVVEVQQLQIAPGKYNFEIQIKDRTSGKMGIYRGQHQLENLWAKDSLLVSDVILSGPIGQAKPGDKFVKQDVRYIPHMFSDFKIGEEVGLYFEIYNLSYNAEGLTNFRITCTLRPFGEERASSIPLAGFFKSLFDKEKGTVSTSYDYQGKTPNEKIYINLDFQGQRAGTYELLMDVEDLQARKTARKSIKIKIK